MRPETKRDEMDDDDMPVIVRDGDEVRMSTDTFDDLMARLLAAEGRRRWWWPFLRGGGAW